MYEYEYNLCMYMYKVPGLALSKALRPPKRFRQTLLTPGLHAARSEE